MDPMGIPQEVAEALGVLCGPASLPHVAQRTHLEFLSAASHALTAEVLISHAEAWIGSSSDASSLLADARWISARSWVSVQRGI